MKAEKIFDLTQYTEEGQKKILEAIAIFEKMAKDLTPDEIHVMADFDNGFRFGFFDLIQAKLKEVKPELFTEDNR